MRFSACTPIRSFGTGYESFWLGPRLESLWQLAGAVNEAHNGYLEVYLNLGLVGLFLLGGFLIGSYRTICKQLLVLRSRLASLALALWTIMLFYNMTEAAFKFHLMWLIFLMAAIAIPSPAENQLRRVGAIESAMPPHDP